MLGLSGCDRREMRSTTLGKLRDATLIQLGQQPSDNKMPSIVMRKTHEVNCQIRRQHDAVPDSSLDHAVWA